MFCDCVAWQHDVLINALVLTRLLYTWPVSKEVRKNDYSVQSRWMGDCLWADKPSQCVPKHLDQLSLPSPEDRFIEYWPVWLGLGGVCSLVLGGR